MSPRLWEVLGFDAEEMPHRAEAWQHLIHPEDLQTANANFNAHCADPSHPYDQLVRYRHKDGSTVWVRCRGVAIRDESNNPIRMLGAHNEVTLLKQAEQELSEAVEHLERSNRNLEEFASVASHDLQAPLQTITNFLTLLQFSADERLTENEQHYIERAVDAAQRQSQMVRALLDWSRVQMHDMSRRPVDTGELVAEVTSELRASLDEANAEVLVDDLPLVRADPVLLRRVFQNLLHNALKFRSERPPRVHIRAQPVRSTWSFRVEDNGIGFDSKYNERVFDFGERLHGKARYEGSGIGLAVCQRVIRDHGGDIRAEGRAGQGATFVFTIPF